MRPKNRAGLHGLLWTVLLGGLPLAVHPLSSSLTAPFKTELALAITGMLVATAPRATPRPASPAQTWTFRALALMLAVRWIGTVRSVAPGWSLWGDPFWWNGLWLHLVGATVFWLAARHFEDPARRASALRVIATGSALVAAVGVMQAAGVHVSGLRQDGPRVASTMAHPAFLGAYMAATLPLTLHLRARAPGCHRRAWTAALALQGMALVFSYSRAGWLAAAAGITLWYAVRLWTAGHRRTVIALLAALGILIGVLFGLSRTPAMSTTAPFGAQTITSMFRWESATARIRLLGWEAAWSAIQARPWLGYGPATFRAVLEWHMPPDFAPFDSEATLAGRPHNLWLEVAVESGIVGLAAYGVLLAMLVVPVARTALGQAESAAGQDRRAQATAILALLAAWLVNNQLSFESAEMVVLLWAVLGLAHSADRLAMPPNPSTPWRGRPAGWRWLAAAAGIGLALLLAWPEYAAWRAARLVDEERWSQAVRLLDDAAATAPNPDPLLLDLGRVYGWWALEPETGTEEGAQRWDRAAAAYETLLARRSDVAEYWMRYASLLHQRFFVARDPAVGQRALTAYSAAIRLSPRNPDHWLDRGLLYLDLGAPDRALADFEEAGRLLPDYVRYYGVMVIYAQTVGDAAAAAAWEQRRQAAQRDWDDWLWRR